MKITWRVEPEPVGLYRSFSTRAWPIAHYEDGSCAFRITCDTENEYDGSYTAHKARTGEHPPLTVWFADYSEGRNIGWRWRKLKQRATSLKEAKSMCKKFGEQCAWAFAQRSIK